MLPLDEIRKHFPNASEKELKQIQESVYLLCCGVMQYFYGEDWDESIEDLSFENRKG